MNSAELKLLLAVAICMFVMAICRLGILLIDLFG